MTITPQIILLLALLALSIAIVAMYLIRLYNSLVFMRNNAEKAFANIDILLQQRFQEIPNQLASVLGATEHENTLLSSVTELRKQTNLSGDSVSTWQQRLHHLNLVFSGFDRVILRAEDYPQLTSNDLFIHLQNRITEFENMIAEAREFYNQCSILYNDKLMIIPNRYLMAPAGFLSLELLHQRQAVKG